MGSRKLPPVQIVGVDTVTMTDEQYQAAVEALAVLIAAWEASTATAQEDQPSRAPTVDDHAPADPAQTEGSPT